MPRAAALPLPCPFGPLVAGCKYKTTPHTPTHTLNKRSRLWCLPESHQQPSKCHRFRITEERRLRKVKSDSGWTKRTCTYPLSRDGIFGHSDKLWREVFSSSHYHTTPLDIKPNHFNSTSPLRHCLTGDYIALWRYSEIKPR